MDSDINVNTEKSNVSGWINVDKLNQEGKTEIQCNPSSLSLESFDPSTTSNTISSADSIKSLEIEIAEIENSLDLKKTFLKDSINNEAFEIAATTKAELNSLNVKFVEMKSLLADLKRQSFSKKLPDAKVMQALYFKNNWELYYQKKHDRLKPHLDDALSAISVFIEAAANVGQGYVSCRMHKDFGFQLIYNGLLISWNKTFLTTLTDLVSSNTISIPIQEAEIVKLTTELEKGIDHGYSEGSHEYYEGRIGDCHARIDRLNKSTQLCKEYINEINGFSMPDETLTSLESVFNDVSSSGGQPGIYWLRYTLLNAGYKVGSNAECPLILSLRGDTSHLKRSYEMYTMNNIPGYVLNLKSPVGVLFQSPGANGGYYYLKPYEISINFSKVFWHSVDDIQEHFRLIYMDK